MKYKGPTEVTIGTELTLSSDFPCEKTELFYELKRMQEPQFSAYILQQDYYVFIL